jgi:CRISPR-associated protein Cas2
MKKYIVVAYDIAEDKRRNKICEILSGYGRRVNYSVFECFLGERDIRNLRSRIMKHFKKGEDIVLYYYLCKDCLEKVERIGNFSEEKQVVKII